MKFMDPHQVQNKELCTFGAIIRGCQPSWRQATNRFGDSCVADRRRRVTAAKKATTKKTSRGRKQDRAKVAGGQDYEVRHEARKSGRAASAVKKVGNSRKKVERRLER